MRKKPGKARGTRPLRTSGVKDLPVTKAGAVKGGFSDIKVIKVVDKSSPTLS
jgi:hypothetical protein